MTIDMGLLDSPQQHHVPNAIGFEGIDQLIQLPDLNPMQPIDMSLKLGICFPFMCYRRHVQPHLARVIGKDDRETSVPRNHSDSAVRYGHGTGHSGWSHTC